ncbi:MAG: hypothetical protein HC822_05720 [Oscillochloris sp.]|nr:hypothetical protein [Oscillochloris sp.]
MVDLPPSAFLGESDYNTTTRAVDLGDGPMITAGARAYRPRYEMRPLVDMSWGERLALPFRLTAISIGAAWRASRTRRHEPQQRSIPRGRGLSYRRTRPPFPWLPLLSLTTIVAVLIGYGILLSQQNSARLAEEYLSIAEQRLAEVRASSDETVALERLDIASEAIDEVLASPEVTRTNSVLWTRYQELQREYERSLASVQRLTFFDDPIVLASHPLDTGRFSTVVVPAQLSGITDTTVLKGLRYVYALDAGIGNAQLYRIPRDGGEAETYLAPNQPVGTTVVGPLRAALWRIDQVVAIDSAPSGFGYYFRQAGGWNYSKLGASEIWNASERLDVEEYLGNLYLWGAQPGEILKYNSGRYGDAPDFWLQTGGAGDNDLTTVVDMAVDGSIYLLQPNGTILVFSEGQVVGTIAPQGLIPPISTVTRLVVTGPPAEGSIFLLEPLAERIIQLDKISGEMMQQIKIRPDDELRLNELTGLTVDDSGSRPMLYIINGGQIIRADLPPPPRSFFEEVDEPTP